MSWQDRMGQGTGAGPGGRDRRRSGIARRRSVACVPMPDGLEPRQVLSAAAVAPMVLAAQAAPTTAPAPVPGSVIFHAMPLPLTRAEAGRPFNSSVASFIANTKLQPQQLRATIDWGDGQLGVGTIVPNAWGGFNVHGQHTYAATAAGRETIRVDVADATTGRWLAGTEQQAIVSPPRLVRSTLEARGLITVPTPADPANRPQPERKGFVDTRQKYQDAMSRYKSGTASASDIQYLKQVQSFLDNQNKSFFQKLGDKLASWNPFNKKK